MRRALPALVLILTLAGLCAAQQAPETPKHLRIRTFERVWQIVNERFYDPHFNGIDWKAVHKRYAPRIAAVGNASAFYDLLNEMLGELKQSHMHVYAPWEYSDQDAKPGSAESTWAWLNVQTGPGDGEAGMTVGVVEGRPVVTQVRKGSAAEAAGVRPGLVVLAAQGQDLLEKLKSLGKTEPNPRDRDREFTWSVQDALEGSVGERTTLEVLDGDDKPRTLTMTLRPAVGEPCSFAEMPTLYATLEARRLQSGIGYLRFNAFLLPLLDKLKNAIDSFQGAKGIVIDLRGNPGGIGAIVLPIAGRLVNKPTLLGISKMRTGEFRELANPQKPYFAGPVAVLVDETSASASEMLAGGLQECGRVSVVGRRTAGAVLPSTFEKLPDGARLQYVVAVFHTPKGVLLEGRGVIPNVPVVLTRKALLAGGDPDLDAAVAALLK